MLHCPESSTPTCACGCAHLRALSYPEAGNIPVRQAESWGTRCANGVARSSDIGLVRCGRRTVRGGHCDRIEPGKGGPELAKGGSGDVLAGLTAGFFAQAGKARGFTHRTALESAALAVYLHGRAGDLAAKKLTERCVLAGELLEFLPAALRSVKK